MRCAARSSPQRFASASNARCRGFVSHGGPGMARSDAFRRVKRAYELPHLYAAGRAIVIAALLVVIAMGLYRVTRATYLVATVLATSMAAFAWRGGAWRRGASAGVLAGLPPLLIPSIVWTLSSGAGHCASC